MQGNRRSADRLHLVRAVERTQRASQELEDRAIVDELDQQFGQTEEQRARFLESFISRTVARLQAQSAYLTAQDKLDAFDS